ncbi:MAG: hypothetical protein LLG04_18875 [Parachlamydia sp.]|nr:hypothetical protein [Parachlamydia sp.]
MEEKLDPKFVLRLVNDVFDAIEERYPDNTSPAAAASTAVYAGINVLRLIYNMSNANKEG